MTGLKPASVLGLSGITITHYCDTVLRKENNWTEENRKPERVRLESASVTIQPGTRLGPYEILAAVGAGGMGEVYRAKDTRLDRTVAIKVLPAHLAVRADLKERFEREARAVSNLNHPHICTLYDIGQQDGVAFLVMEFIEGESLADRLRKGPLPVAQALQYAEQIADALDKAHRQGVVHRDLKPGNIMLARSGAKLLDFGLAKLQEPAPAFSSETAIPTQASGLTIQGTILGTLQYMAPEQLEGKEADARTDIFAFGAVLYEMVTGKRAFEGKSQVTIIAAIVNSEPAKASSIQSNVSAAVDHLIKRCIAKEPDARWQTASDLVQELKWISNPESVQSVPIAPSRVSSGGLFWKAAAVVLLLTTLGAGDALYRNWGAEEGRPIRFQVGLPEKSNFASPAGGDLGANSGTLSPDGRYLTFAATDADGKPKLWVRGLDSTSAQPLSGTEGPSYPFWSPDSRYIGFFAEGKLKKVQFGGSPPETICDAPRPRGGAWNSDNVIVFAPDNPGALFRVSAAGGVPAAVTKMDESRKERSHRWPYFLPDKTHFLYLALGTPDENTGVWVGSLGSDPPKRLFTTTANVVYNSGRLLFLRDNALMAQPFNLSKLELTREPIRIADQIASDPSTSGGGYGLAAFSVSEHGELSYRSGAATVKTQLTWLDHQGRPMGTVGPVGDYWNPVISPDGRQIAVEKRDPSNRDIWIFDLARGTETRFTFYAGVDLAPLWSADGKRIAWESARDGIGQLYVKEAAGVGEEKPLLESKQNKAPVDWAPDNTLFYAEFDAKTRFHIKKLTYPGDAKPSPVLNSMFQESLAALSPDGHWLAYVSNESGLDEVYIQTYPTSGSKWQISTNNGTEIKWKRDGKELFYMTIAGEIMSVNTSELKQGGPFAAASPKSLFKTTIRNSGEGRTFDVSPDGKRFLVNIPADSPSNSQITIFTRWDQGLK